jgi:hypothetical protein
MVEKAVNITIFAVLRNTANMVRVLWKHKEEVFELD